ncbi:MAG: DNA repair protein RecO [Pigmentiphaga sp.]|nr:DNA repair protein RecO [Pigmentiphaga sp.]
MATRQPTPRFHDIDGFLLHPAPWRETSLLLDTYTREQGRVAMVAKGARRPTSSLRPALAQFQPLSLSWSGAGEVKTLIRIEWCAPLRVYGGAAAMSAWYMNELLIRLLPREDPHPALYDAYDTALRQLAEGGRAAGALRRFEWILLRETGYGVEGPAPDFEDPAIEPELRRFLRDRLDDQLEHRPLVTRQVAQALQRLKP